MCDADPHIFTYMNAAHESAASRARHSSPHLIHSDTWESFPLQLVINTLDHNVP